MTGLGNKPGEDAGQRAFHAGDRHNDVRALEQLHPRQHPVQARDADIVDSFHPISHDFRGDRGFLGDRQITRAGADDGDESGAAWAAAFSRWSRSGRGDDGPRA